MRRKRGVDRLVFSLSRAAAVLFSALVILSSLFVVDVVGTIGNDGIYRPK